ncbi:hypothetical protein O4H49_10765 [Kiloniella laminariae]|uniref:Peptidase S1 domain-containing protein n=1 Tax=Kiloniella laminariae TaxID=454162 RepID=A0ABT4LJI3_9PROT|nr:hypothetical protein [Kiloniella laminariae]MCZ4281261.1 hypothetical protein [Kiloniella laminariae]
MKKQKSCIPSGLTELILPGLCFLIALFLTACASNQQPETALPPSPAPPAETAVESPGVRSTGFLADGSRAELEAREYPWSTLGRLNVAGRHFCNAVMVGKAEILAPASCLYSAVEGRWFQPREMAFVAGYQRDDSTIFSAAASYQVARGFVPTGNDLVSLLNNWALIRLEAPLGDHTGWLGVKDNLAANDLTMMAGYRRGWEHLQALYPLCNQTPASKTYCPKQTDGRLNQLVLDRNGLFLTPGSGLDPQTRASWNLPAAPWRPKTAFYVNPLPENSVQRLLVELGYLQSDSADYPQALTRAQRTLGASTTGEADMETLYLLLQELNRTRKAVPLS